MSSFYFVSYQTKIQKSKNEWDIVSQAAKYFFSLGDCLAWLNDRFNIVCENYSKQEGFFFWTIRSEVKFFHGLFKIEKENFLEKVLESIKLKEVYYDTGTE